MHGIEHIGNFIDNAVLAYFLSYRKDFFTCRFKIHPSHSRPLESVSKGCFEKTKEGVQFKQCKTYIIHLLWQRDKPGIPLASFNLEWVFKLHPDKDKLSLISTECSAPHFWHGEELAPAPSNEKSEKGKD